MRGSIATLSQDQVQQGEGRAMSKQAVKIGVRIVERPQHIEIPAGQPYQPPKKQLFKAIATCELNGRRLSKTASKETEEASREEAFSKLATLVAKQGAFPVKGFGLRDGEADAGQTPQ